MAPSRRAAAVSTVSAAPAVRTAPSVGFGGLDVTSHDDVLMLLVKLNLCLTACVLGVLLFIAGGKLRRWRSRRACVSWAWDGAGAAEGSPAKKSRSWRQRIAASSARLFPSEQARKERELERELSHYSAAPAAPMMSATFRPDSATIFHWSPAPARAMPMAAPPLPQQQLQQQPSSPPAHSMQLPTTPPASLQSYQQQQQLQRPQPQYLQRQYYRPSQASSSDSLSAESAASAAALLTCRCPHVDLRLHNTPASSEFSLDELLSQHARSLRSQQPPAPPQTPTSESVITGSSSSSNC